MRENIRLKQQGCLPRSRGSTKRSYPESWKIAFENFDLTQQILRDAPLEIRTEPMESESFSRWIREQDNLWIYASNITQFHFFDLEFADPTNVVLIQIIHPAQPQLLDLAPLSGGPVRVHFEIPLRAERIDRLTAATLLFPLHESTTDGHQDPHPDQRRPARPGDLLAGHSHGRPRLRHGSDRPAIPETGKLEEGLEAQTRRVLANIDAILNAAGCSNADIVKVTLLLADIKDFKAVDQIYAAWLPGHGVTPAKPARTAFQAAALPAGALAHARRRGGLPRCRSLTLAEDEWVVFRLPRQDASMPDPSPSPIDARRATPRPAGTTGRLDQHGIRPATTLADSSSSGNPTPSPPGPRGSRTAPLKTWGGPTRDALYASSSTGSDAVAFVAERRGGLDADRVAGQREQGAAHRVELPDWSSFGRTRTAVRARVLPPGRFGIHRARGRVAEGVYRRPAFRLVGGVNLRRLVEEYEHGRLGHGVGLVRGRRMRVGPCASRDAIAPTPTTGERPRSRCTTRSGPRPNRRRSRPDIDLGSMEVQLHGWVKQGVLVLALFRRFKGEAGESSYFDREFFYLTDEHAKGDR